MRGHSIRFQCVTNPSYADYEENGHKPVGCGQPVLGLIFFFSFVILVSLIFLNLFIAIILQKYTETQDNRETVFNPELSENFRDTWAQYDPDATGFLPITRLKSFLFALGAPLGWDESYLTHMADGKQK